MIRRYLRSFLGPGYKGMGLTRRFEVPGGVEVLQSGWPDSGQIFLLSPGFGATLTDYGPLVRLYEKRGLVVRVQHTGSTRWDALRALLHLIRYRLKGFDGISAAQMVRSQIHSQKNRERRLGQLEVVADYYREAFPEHHFSVIGHSYGSDTAILFCLERPVEHLYLFSNHPPGYLVPEDDYECIKAAGVSIVTGSRDTTRDGVGPGERLQVVDYLQAEQLAGIQVLPGVRHMDFAFDGWGPSDWLEELERALL